MTGSEGAECAEAVVNSPVVLSQWVLIALWSFILLYQVAVASILVGFLLLYATANDQNSLLGFLRTAFLFSEAQTFLTTVSKPLAVCFGCLSSMFVYEATTMVVYSLARRQFCYGPRCSETLYKAPSTETPHKVPHRLVSTARRPIRQFSAFYAIGRSFGVSGRYFHAGNLIRNLVETVLLTITAYSSSQTISDVGVNLIYGALIAINCFLPALFDRAFRRRNPLAERLACGFMDLIMDFVWGIGIPFLVFLPYIRLYQLSQASSSTYVSPPNVEQEVERILVLSTASLIQAIVPFLSTLVNLRGIKQVLTKARPAKVYAGDLTTAAIEPSAVTDSVITKQGDDTASQRLVRWAQGLLIAYGVAMLVISICATGLVSRQREISLYDCSHPVYPWLVSKQACTGRTIECPAVGIEGRAEEIASALDSFDESTMMSLVLSQCSQLEIPSTITRFSQMRRVTILNSQLLEWSTSASAADFHSLRTVVIMNVTLAREPVGLTRVQLPISLEWIYLSHVDVSLFIDDLGQNWKDLRYFYCDACNLTRVPAIVRTMRRLRQFSSSGNAIHSINETQFAASIQLSDIWLDGSPLAILPDWLWRMSSSLNDFSFQSTAIAHVPSWVNDFSNLNLRMHGYGIPLCANAVDRAQVHRLVCEEYVY